MSKPLVSWSELQSQSFVGWCLLIFTFSNDNNFNNKNKIGWKNGIFVHDIELYYYVLGPNFDVQLESKKL